VIAFVLWVFVPVAVFVTALASVFTRDFCLTAMMGYGRQ
jgi:hypothetical protein